MRVARQVALNGSELLRSAATQKFKKRQLQRLQLNLHSSAGRCRLDFPNSLWDRDSLFRSYYTLLLVLNVR
jgi:hypothetical protein